MAAYPSRELVVQYWMFTFMCLIPLMFGILFIPLSTSLGCFCPRTFFLNKGLDDIRRACFFISDLHTKLRIISRRVLGFVTGSPCGVWGRGWTTCLLYDRSLLDLCFWKWHWVRNCGIVPLYLYPEITSFYIKYFVLPFSIDAISTFSYHMICFCQNGIPMKWVGMPLFKSAISYSKITLERSITFATDPKLSFVQT